MSGMGAPHDARRLELLADRALEGLSDEEARELDFVARAEGAGDDSSLDLAAASVARTSVAGRLEPMPADVADRVRAALAEAGADAGSVAGRVDGTADAAPGGSLRRTVLRSLAGFAAAAAVLVAAFVGMRDRVQPASLEPAEARARLIAAAPADLVTMRWRGTDHPRVREARDLGLLSGDLVWSEERAEGFVRVCHLAVNDPAEGHYRVWVWNADDMDGPPVAVCSFDVTNPQRDTVAALQATEAIDVPVRASITFVPTGTVVDRPEPSEELLVARRTPASLPDLDWNGGRGTG